MVYRLGPLNALVRRLHPMLESSLIQQGFDPADYRRRLNETTRRRLQPDVDRPQEEDWSRLPVIEQWPA